MYAKDYGMYLYDQTKDLPDPPMWLMKNYTFYNLAVLEPDLFSSTANTEVDGEPYAMTVDFDRQIFDKILELLPDDKSERLREVVDNNQSYPIMMRLDEDPIVVDLRVRLGELQHGDGEDFISMIIMDVSEAEN